MTVDEAHELIGRAVDAGRPANGYLIVGGVRGMGGELADRVLARVFGGGDLSAHPDIHRLVPEKKSRVISVDAMRTRMIAPMDMSSFQGGWKAGVVLGADRMKEEAANAFLKTLEEPPPHTLFLLLTDRAERLLPTIVSRCQRIDLPDAGARTLPEPWRGRVIEILSDGALAGRVSRAGAAARLAAILAELKERAADEVGDELDDEADAAGEEAGKEAVEALIASRYREYRADFTAVLTGWFRDLMAMRAAPASRMDDGGGDRVPLVNEAKRSVLESRAANITLTDAFRNIEAVEAFSVSMERNLQELPALDFLTDRLVFGTDKKA